MYEIMHDMKTIMKKKPFKYKYISNGNKEIFFREKRFSYGMN
jgi:hypothetical protein